MTTSKTKKKATRKPVETDQGKRHTIRPESGGIDLLRIADKVGLQQYAAEGIRDRRTRAIAELVSMEEGKRPSAILQAQYIREIGAMDQDEIFAGMDSFAEETAWEDRELNRLSMAIDAKYKEYGAADDEDWPDGEAPEDMEELRTAFDKRFLQLKLSFLRHHGEDTMADLLENDPDEYAARVDKGRKIFEANHAAGKYAKEESDEKTE
jgi:hypothetical protein